LFDDFKKLDEPDIVMVPAPDHPVLMTPPDALIAKNGKILAYYKIHSNEKARPNLLLSRLALCRFALPVHTQHVLVTDEGIDNLRIQKIFSFFDESIEHKDIQLSLRLLRNVSSKLTIDRASEGRDQHYVKYNVLYEASLKQNDGADELHRALQIDPSVFEKAFYADWLQGMDGFNEWRKKESRYFHKSGRSYFAVPEFHESKRKHELLRNLCVASMLIGSDYHDGFYRVQSEESRLLLSDKLPGYRHDSLKGVRSAAFAGLGLSQARNEDSIKKYSEYLSYRLERGLHEFRKKKNRYNKRNRNR